MIKHKNSGYNYACLNINDSVNACFLSHAHAAIICSSLPIINNGVIRYSPDTTGAFNYATVATYICNEGFFLDGVENRTCGGDGSSTTGGWTETAPVCSGEY